MPSKEEYKYYYDKIDSDEFFEKYKPQMNHFHVGNPNQDEFYETFGKELEYVKEQPDNLIWTVIEEDGVTCFIQGFHFVNRFQYLIATVPYKRGDKETYYDAVDDWCIECDGGQEENENCKECGGKGYYEYR